MSVDTKELWQIVYRAFNRTNESFEMPAVIGAIPASKEVERRLLNSIAGLSDGHDPTAAEIEAIRGDILIAEASGWLPNDSAEKAHRILDLWEGSLK